MKPSDSNQSSDNKQPIKAAIQQQAEANQLKPDQLQHLMQMQMTAVDSVEPQHSPTDLMVKRIWLTPLMASAATILMCFVLWQNIVQPQQLMMDIAHEVVENHLKLKPLDVKTQSIATLHQFFTQLDFSPVNSQLLTPAFALTESAMLGGRYCSIKGQTAAQLRYQPTNQNISTLYQVAYDPELFGSIPNLESGGSPHELFLKGLKVSLWSEKGLLMVMVNQE